jgi:carbon storage regulator
MLVLTRKIGERIRIGDNITLIVTKMSGNRVTLGIDAPTEVRIVRGELDELPPVAAAEAPPLPQPTGSILPLSGGVEAAVPGA